MASNQPDCNNQQFLEWSFFFFFFCFLLTRVFVVSVFSNPTAHDFAVCFSRLFASIHQPGEVLRRYEYQ